MPLETRRSTDCHQADGAMGISTSGERRRLFHADAQRVLQSNQGFPVGVRISFQALPKFPLAVVGSAERAVATVDAHRNEIVRRMANASMPLQRRLAEGDDEVIPTTAGASLDPPTDNT